jgi:tripartite-type tricarboxylate transporter receptor subunit TctC
MPRIKHLLAALALLLWCHPAHAQDKFPSKPIKVVVPFGAGSATDIVIRIVGEQMRHDLGQQVVVENKPGAFGILAIEEMARARPDGYTLQVGNPGTNMLTPVIYKDKFKIDYDKDVVMVTRLGEVPLVLCATNKDFAPKTYAEFIALAKAQPNKVRYASVGVGSNNHYDMEAFSQWAGIKMVHIPNKGGGAAITNDVVSGDAHVAWINAASSAGVVKGGLLKPLAVMADARLPEYPDVPTLKELGYGDNDVTPWWGGVVPAGTPRPVIERLAAWFNQISAQEDTQQFLARSAFDPFPGSPDQMQALMRSDAERWKRYVELARIEPQ